MEECIEFAIELDMEQDSNTKFISKDQKFNEFLHTKKSKVTSISHINSVREVWLFLRL